MGAVDAPSWPEEIYRKEWAQVVRAQDITNRDDYLRASRHGQGFPLTRPQRAEVWQVMEAFRGALVRSQTTEWDELPNLARRRIETERPALPYRAIVVDETQDLSMAQLKLLRAMVPPGPNDLFLVGDAHQRIYGRPVVLSHCGIDVRGRASTLKINYRTTEEIRDWAVQVLSGEVFDDLDGGEDELRGYRSLLSGPKPMVRQFGSEQEEITWIASRMDDLIRDEVPASSICLVAHHRKQVARYQHALERLDIPTLLLDGRVSDAGEGVRVATMHRVKGLEFAHVFLAGADASALPADPRSGDLSDALRLRCLVHVAATRARDTLAVSWWGAGSGVIAIE
jgi:superfamily I DNA/RNA helicase